MDKSPSIILRLLKKIRRTILHLRLKPVRVFCFHVIGDTFNPETTWDIDFTQTDRFKAFICNLRENGYSFISLSDAYEHIKHDVIRIKKYACITFDDGEASISTILPWLNKQDIPVTLFVNPKFLLGEGQREKPMKLLSIDELSELVNKYGYHNRLSVGNHSYGHEDCSCLSGDSFRFNIEKSELVLSQIKNKVPFFAYPCGTYSVLTDRILADSNLIPVYCDGQMNYNDQECIHREILI